MSGPIELNRRSFLRTAGMSALAGAVTTRTSLAAPALSPPQEPTSGQYDFDALYDRVGTDCSKWDDQIEKYGKENIEVAMGVADMDFRVAPCVTRALQKRVNHENWGYGIPDVSYKEAIAAWNRDRHGVEVDPDTIHLAAGVHPALIAGLRAFSPPGSKVLMTTPIYSGFYTDLRETLTVTADSLGRIDNGRYSIDWDDLESQMDVDTHVLILCNPQNPTGKRLVRRRYAAGLAACALSDVSSFYPTRFTVTSSRKGTSTFLSRVFPTKTSSTTAFRSRRSARRSASRR